MFNERQIKQLKALAEPTRAQIVEVLRGKELCACHILDHFSISQPTLSHHMKILTDCGLIKIRKEGIWNHYELQLDQFHALSESLKFEVEACNICEVL